MMFGRSCAVLSCLTEDGCSLAAKTVDTVVGGMEQRVGATDGEGQREGWMGEKRKWGRGL
jgi:hypothetical protein